MIVHNYRNYVSLPDAKKLIDEKSYYKFKILEKEEKFTSIKLNGDIYYLKSDLDRYIAKYNNIQSFIYNTWERLYNANLDGLIMPIKLADYCDVSSQYIPTCIEKGNFSYETAQKIDKYLVAIGF